MDDKYLIIYHKEDNDGLFSMAIIYNYLTEEKHINRNMISLFGADYNMMENINIHTDIIDQYDYVYITDISFDNAETMRELRKTYGNKLTWFDHHAPMINKSEELHFDDIPGTRTTKHSALYNAFTYLYNFVGRIPDLFKVLSAWDSWSYEAENINFDFCRYVNIGVNNKYDLNIEKIINYVYDIIYTYDHIELSAQINELKDLGKLECNIIDRNNKNLIKTYGDFTWTVGPDNRSACALFIQKPTNSQIFSSCKERVQNGIVFKRLTDGMWTISLYNPIDTNEFHCGKFLQEYYNGGGHEGAAGAQITEDEFIKILKAKHI